MNSAPTHSFTVQHIDHIVLQHPHPRAGCRELRG